jgi:hypothetical protein
MFALSGIVLLASMEQHLLGGYSELLRSLFSVKRFMAVGADLLQAVADVPIFCSAPDSWKQGARQLRPLADGVRVEWRLPVERVKQACSSSFAQQKALIIRSPSSCQPLAGRAWQLLLICGQQGGGTIVRLGVLPVGAPTEFANELCYKCRFSIQCGGRTLHSMSSGTPRFAHFAEIPVGPMTDGGWDEAAWAAAGLPLEGDAVLQLQVHSVE